MHNDDDAAARYRALINGQAQYAIWPATRAPPRGWRDAGFEGVKSECLNWIRRAWTDMRPAELREFDRGGASTSSAKEMRS